jgi:hypothetical protein
VFRAGWVARSERPRSVRQNVDNSESTFCPSIEGPAKPITDMGIWHLHDPHSSHLHQHDFATRGPQARLSARRGRDSYRSPRAGGAADFVREQRLCCYETTCRVSTPGTMASNISTPRQAERCLPAVRSLSVCTHTGPHCYGENPAPSSPASKGKSLHASLMYVDSRSCWANQSLPR